MTPGGRTLRSRVFDLLEPHATSKASDRALDIFLMLLIALNVLAVCVESVESIAARYGEALWWFELVSVVIFTIEYVLRVWTSIENEKFGASGPVQGRLRYMVTFLVITDLVVILPFYLSLVGFGLDLRFLRVVRLRRGFRLTRYAGGLGLLNEVIQQERKVIGSVAFAVLLMVIATSSALFIAESAVNPAFSSIPATMWWTVNTLTTVGHASVEPMTDLGRVLGGGISMLGLVMVGLTAGVLGSGFSSAARRRRLKFERAVMARVRAGRTFDEAIEDLDDMARGLALRAAAVEEIRADLEYRHPRIEDRCPCCGRGGDDAPKSAAVSDDANA